MIVLDGIPGISNGPIGPWAGLLHVASDLLIGQSYVVIAGLLAALVYRARRAIPFHWMFLAFGTFIVACGTGHFMHVVLLLRPEWWVLYAGVQALTVVASVSTAMLMPPLLPKALELVETARQAEQHRAQLTHQAFHDALTDLPNRAYFLDRLEQALLRNARRPQDQYAVLFFDLDRFKNVNDSLGHLVGDQLLIEFARQLRGCLRKTDTVARFGGDEFAILLEGIKRDIEAARIARRVQQLLSKPFTLEGHVIFVSTSIGIVLGKPEYQRPEDVLRDADIALYRAKAQGRGGHVFFDAEMHAQAVAILQLENELRQAIAREEFVLHYQPVITLATGEPAGFEALIRWQHPERGLLGPGEFIPLAEETGLIVPLGWWGLREACRQARRWTLEAPLDDPPAIGVNLSARQFAQRDLVEQIELILFETGLAPQQLRLEITESALMEQAAAAAVVLGQLRKLGVQVQIDDFGTGYSSLAYLQRFAVDALKIDRSFISGASVTDEHDMIVAAIVQLAHNLRLAVVAEGVETREQLARLAELGCEYGQGYYFARPLPADEAARFLGRALPARA